MMRWYLLALIFLLDEVHLKVAMGYSVDDQRLVKRSSTSGQTQFQQTMLKAHNTYRAEHCAQALSINSDLCQSALKWATYLASINQLQHSGTSHVGENIYVTSGNSADANAVTAAWYNENSNYNFQLGQFAGNTGHFTQVVWNSTTSFCVGYASTSDGQATYVVAQYSPPGNYIGDFLQNVFQKGHC